MLDQQRDAERGSPDDPRGPCLYRRPMPGGGYVEVELENPAPEGQTGPDCMLHGRIILERRADARRRYGHQAPVVAELRGDDRDELMAELFQLARDNAALARNLMRLQTGRLQTGRQHAD